MWVDLPVIHLWSTKQINSSDRKEKDKKDSKTVSKEIGRKRTQF